MEIRPWSERIGRCRDERRLGGLGNRRQCGEARRCRNVETGACESILKTARDIQTQPVDKYRDNAGSRRGGRAGHIGPVIRHWADGLLQRTSTVVEPLPIQGCTSGGHGAAIPRAAYRGERPDDGIVGPPSSSRVVVHERSKTRITEGRGGHFGKRHELLERERERRLIQVGPDGASSPPVVLLEECDLLAGAVRCQHREVAQPIAELVLGLFVLLRPGVDVIDDELVRAGSAELVSDPGVSVWQLREPPPHVRPLALPGAELPGGGDLAVGTRVKPEVRLALLDERGPARRVGVRLEAMRVVEPPQEAADCILVHKLEQ